jgi:hypothetical protein
MGGGKGKGKDRAPFSYGHSPYEHGGKGNSKGKGKGHGWSNMLSRTFQGAIQGVLQDVMQDGLSSVLAKLSAPDSSSSSNGASMTHSPSAAAQHVAMQPSRPGSSITTSILNLFGTKHPAVTEPAGMIPPPTPDHAQAATSSSDQLATLCEKQMDIMARMSEMQNDLLQKQEKRLLLQQSQPHKGYEAPESSATSHHAHGTSKGSPTTGGEDPNELIDLEEEAEPATAEEVRVQELEQVILKATAAIQDLKNQRPVRRPASPMTPGRAAPARKKKVVDTTQYQDLTDMFSHSQSSGDAVAKPVRKR